MVATGLDSFLRVVCMYEIDCVCLKGSTSAGEHARQWGDGCCWFACQWSESLHQFHKAEVCDATAARLLLNLIFRFLPAIYHVRPPFLVNTQPLVRSTEDQD